MAKKPRTEKQLANDERLRQQAAERKNKNPETQTPQNHSTEEPGIAELTKMVLELKSQLEEKQTPDLAQSLAAALGNNQPRQTKVTDKYSLDLTLYQDPRERLRQEPRLQRVAFDANYELDWEVLPVTYETRNDGPQREPKFTLSLVQVVLDDDGEPTNKRVGKARMVFFEDPATAIVIANQHGLPVDEENERDFLNAMRYLRIRDWLFECFWPPRTDQTKSNKRMEVIGGQQVETWEISTEGSAKIPFGELNTKLKA